MATCLCDSPLCGHVCMYGCWSIEDVLKRLSEARLLSQYGRQFSADFPSQPMVHALSLSCRLMDIFCLCRCDYMGRMSPQHTPVFCPAICKALWDMTNGVLRLKDGGVWYECSLGRGEVNYLGLNSYVVPLQGSSQQTGEESDAF